MTVSKLAEYVRCHASNSGQRKYAVTRITPHCIVGQWSAQKGVDYFCDTDGDGVLDDVDRDDADASCNYVIGSDGKIGCCVSEDNRSWCTSSSDNDNRAITIECASDKTHPYAMTDDVWQSLINLCVDICRRYGKSKLLWFDNKTKSLAYKPADDEMVLTVHRWFANKACPGDWLYQRLPELANIVTSKLQTTATNGAGDYAKEACAWCISNGYISGYGNGNYGWKDNVTREQLAVILHRILSEK